MTADVISHKRSPRKRAPSLGWTARRMTALALTLAALAALAWVAPYVRPVSTKLANPPIHQPMTAAPTPELPYPVAAETPPPARPARPQRRRSGVPLDAQSAHPGEDFEVLTAAELDAISQARPD